MFICKKFSFVYFQEVKYRNPTVIIVEGVLLTTVTTHLSMVTQKVIIFNIDGRVIA